MTNTPEKHREIVHSILENLKAHQRRASATAYAALGPDCRTVIVAAEMQSGKSGIAKGLACQQRLSLRGDEITDPNQLMDTLYILAMVDTSLLEQAKEDFRDVINCPVTNMQHFQKEIEGTFRSPPKLIIIDECHYGSSEGAVRYEKIFTYLEEKNLDCYVVFISATPFSALIAARNDAVLRRNLTTKLVFHKAGSEYRGIGKMYRENQVFGINGRNKNILTRSTRRDEFMDQILSWQGAGWAMVRVSAGSAMDAKHMFVQAGIPAEDVYIVGTNLSGVPANEHVSIDDFKKQYKLAQMFDRKLVAITVAGFRAGINFGNEMKDGIIATWDSTAASVAAVVQANIGRACGYHANTHAKHYTNISAVNAYLEIIDYLEQNCSSAAIADLEGLKDLFENVCRSHNIGSFDVGTRVAGRSNRPSRSLENYTAYNTSDYIVVPCGLRDPQFDPKRYTDDHDYLATITLIREVYLAHALEPRANRSMPSGADCVANWVNGDTFDNKEKATADGTALDRVFLYTNIMDNDEPLRFDRIVPGGEGVDANTKSVAAMVFSELNMSRREDADNKVISKADMENLCSFLRIPYDDTVLVLFKRGEEDEYLTDERVAHEQARQQQSRLHEHSKFVRQF